MGSRFQSCRKSADGRKRTTLLARPRRHALDPGDPGHTGTAGRSLAAREPGGRGSVRGDARDGRGRACARADDARRVRHLGLRRSGRRHGARHRRLFRTRGGGVEPGAGASPCTDHRSRAWPRRFPVRRDGRRDPAPPPEQPLLAAHAPSERLHRVSFRIGTGRRRLGARPGRRSAGAPLGPALAGPAAVRGTAADGVLARPGKSRPTQTHRHAGRLETGG